jgi:hypothetical protein
VAVDDGLPFSEAAKLQPDMAAVDTEAAADDRFEAKESWVRGRWLKVPNFFSPLIAFPACWLVGVGLAQIRVLNVQQPWSGTAWLVMFWTLVAFLFGGIVGWQTATLTVKENPHPRPFAEVLREGARRRTVTMLLLGLVVIGLAGVAYQFASAHSVPLFASHIDVARTTLPGGPTIVSLDVLVIAATIALVLPEHLMSRAALPYLAIAGVALAALLLTAGRDQLVVPPVVAGLVRWRMGRRPALWSLAAITVFMLGAFSIIFYLRAGQEAREAWATELLGRVVHHMPAPLIPLFPLWLAVAMNFNSLARVVDYFPAHHALGHGVYDAGVLHIFVHTVSLRPITDQLTPPWTTSTFAGPLWADDRFIALTIGVGLIGALTTFAYRAAQRSGSIQHLLVSCYLLFLSVFCLYTNMFTIYGDWILVIAGLMLAGSVLEGSGTDRDRAGRLRGLRDVRW